MHVSEIMQTALVTSPPEASVLDVAQLLTQRRVGACLIVENGALAATQFHPEKSGDAGATVLRNWLRDVVG